MYCGSLYLETLTSNEQPGSYYSNLHSSRSDRAKVTPVYEDSHETRYSTDYRSQTDWRARITEMIRLADKTWKTYMILKTWSYCHIMTLTSETPGKHTRTTFPSSSFVHEGLRRLQPGISYSTWIQIQLLNLILVVSTPRIRLLLWCFRKLLLSLATL